MHLVVFGRIFFFFWLFHRQRYSVRRATSIGAAGGGGLGGRRRCGPCCDCVYEKRTSYAGKLAYVCYSSCWGGGSPWREVRTCLVLSRGLYPAPRLNIRWWYRHSFGRSSGRWHGDDHAVLDPAAWADRAALPPASIEEEVWRIAARRVPLLLAHRHGERGWSQSVMLG